MAKRRLGARRGGGGLRATPAALAAIALIGVSIVIVAQLRGPSAGQAGADDVFGGGAAVVTEPLKQAEGAFGFMGRALRADERIETLERENAELRQWRTLALALAERNERYEALLNMPNDGLAKTLAPNAGAAARVVLDVGGPFRRTLLVNAGAVHGVSSGAIAVNEHGLVGRVVLVGQRTSRVLMLDDYNSRVPVMGQLSRVRAVMVGSARATPRLESGIAAEPPGIEFAVGAEGLKTGEPVVTSGDGGLFPAGLVVGYAVQDGSKRWRVRLATADAPIDFVRLLPYSGVEPPEAGPTQSGVPMPPIAPRALTTASAPAAAPVTAAARPRAATAPTLASIPSVPPPRVEATRPIPSEEDQAPPAPDQEPSP